MEKYTKKGIAQKTIIIAIVIFMMLSIIMPTISLAAEDDGVFEEIVDDTFSFAGERLGDALYGAVFRQLQALVVGIGDGTMWILNSTTEQGILNKIASAPIQTFKSPGGVAMDMINNAGLPTGTLNTVFFAEISDMFSELPEILQIPTFSVSPEKIFANQVPLLDANIINPSEDSVVSQLQNVISGWYLTFRNIAIAGLLSVLVYIAIRIMISSTATDKSRYKMMLKDWLVAFCLLFFMHYIMSFANTVTDALTRNLDVGSIVLSDVSKDDLKAKYSAVDTLDLFSSLDSLNYETVDGKQYLKLSLMEYVRFNAQTTGADDVDIMQRFGWTVMYLVLVIYTVMFLFIYIKRLVYLIFLTMIAPLVALTYPIDKVKDGSAQGFNMWLKEYISNLILQPLHLLLYYVLVSSAIGLAAEHPIYAMVVMGFMLQSEKIIRKIFGIDKASTASSLFSGAMGGAAVMQGINWLGSRAKGVAKSVAGGKSGGSDNIRMNDSRKASAGNEIKFDQGIDVLSSGKTKENENTNSTVQTNRNNRNRYEISQELLKKQMEEFDNDPRNITTTQEAIDRRNKMQEEYDALIRDDEDSNQVINTVDIPDEGTDSGTILDNKGTISDDEEEIELTDLPKYDYGELIDDDDGEYRTPKGIKGVAKTFGKYVLKDDSGKTIAKYIAGAAGAATLGTIGLAAGLASDNFGNTVKYGIGAGAVGAGLGSGAVSGSVKAYNNLEEFKDNYRKETMTKEEYQEYINKKSDAMWKTSKEIQRMYQEAFKGKKVKYNNGKTEDAWKAAMREAQKQREYGVTDDKVNIALIKDKFNGVHSDWSDKKWAYMGKLSQSVTSEKDIRNIGKRFEESNKLNKKEIKQYVDEIRKYSGRDI